MAKFTPGKLVGGLIFLALVNLVVGWLISNSVLIIGAVLVLVVVASFFPMLQISRKEYPADFIIIEKSPILLLLTRRQVQSQVQALNLNRPPNSTLRSPAEPSIVPPCRAVREAEEIARAAYHRLYGKF